MAILKIKHNSTLFGSLELAKSGLMTAMEAASKGELWAGIYDGGAVLGFKGENGAVIFSNADSVTAEMNAALANYYTQEEINNLFATKLADYYTKAEVYTKEEVNAHTTDGDIHITADERTAWNKAKSDVDAFLGSAVSEQEAVIDTLKEIQDFLSTEEGGKVKEMLDQIQSAQDAADTAQGEVDTLEGQVAEHVEEFESFKTTNSEAIAAAQKAGEDAAAAVAGDLDLHVEEFTQFKAANTQAIATAQAAAEKVATDAKAAIDAYTVNGKTISENPVLVAGDLAVTPNEKLAATDVQSALEELQEEIAAAVAGGINTIVAGDAISVDATDANNPTVAVKVDSSSIVVVDDKLTVDVIDCGTF